METTKLPLLKQYGEMKKKHPDAILLFRVGDFYETFSDDAVTVSDILGITLTRRPYGEGNKIEIAGFPYNALDTYLPRLTRAGKRVAICEQKENNTSAPKTVKEINCLLSFEQIGELGEPDAFFRLKLPKEIKSLGKYIYPLENLPFTGYLWIIPARGVAVHTDAYYLNIIDVQCSGHWPEDDDTEQNQAFVCPIDPKALSLLAGKTVDVAVWLDDKGNIILAGCETDGIRTQVNNYNYVSTVQKALLRYVDCRTSPVFRLDEENRTKVQEWVNDSLPKVTGKTAKNFKDYQRIRIIAADNELTLLKPGIAPLYLQGQGVEVFKKLDITCNEILFQICINGDRLEAHHSEEGNGLFLWFKHPRSRSLLITVSVKEEEDNKDSSKSNI